MAATPFNLSTGQRAERKQLITVIEWGTGETPNRAILGTRTEDSSIEYNADIETTTDIRGNTYTDMNKTEPEQTFDASPVIGGDTFHEMLNDIRRRNALSELQGFTVYVITAFASISSGDPNPTTSYEAEKHVDCSVTYDSIGGDLNVNFPFTIHFSNKLTTGTVDKLSSDFTFTPDGKQTYTP